MLEDSGHAPLISRYTPQGMHTHPHLHTHTTLTHLRKQKVQVMLACFLLLSPLFLPGIEPKLLSSLGKRYN